MKVSQVKEHVVAKTIERNEGERINLAIYVHHVHRGMWDCLNLAAISIFERVDRCSYTMGLLQC